MRLVYSVQRLQVSNKMRCYIEYSNDPNPLQLPIYSVSTISASEDAH